MGEKLLSLLPQIKAGHYPWMKSPFFLDGYSIATDGNRLLAVNGGFDAPAGMSEKNASEISKWLANREGTGVVAADLVKFFGEKVPASQCQDCDGTGKVERECHHCDEVHRCVCEECVDGIVGPQAKPLKVGPAFVDARLMWDFLAAVDPAETVKVHAPQPERMVTVQGQDWIYVVMPMRWTGKAEREFKLSEAEGQ